MNLNMIEWLFQGGLCVNKLTSLLHDEIEDGKIRCKSLLYYFMDLEKKEEDSYRRGLSE